MELSDINIIFGLEGVWVDCQREGIKESIEGTKYH